MEDEKKELEVTEEVVEAEPEITTVVKTKLVVDYKTLTNYNIFYMKKVRHITAIYSCMIAVALGFAVYNLIRYGMDGIAITVLMAIFGVYLIYCMFTFDRNIDKQLTAYFNKQRPITQEYNLTNVGFTVSTKGKEDITYDWSYITKVFILPDYYYMYLGKTPLIIDRDPSLISEGTKEDLDNLLEEVCKSKPIKRFDKPMYNKPIEFEYPDYDAMDRAREEELASLQEEAAPTDEVVSDATEVDAEEQNNEEEK